MLKEDLSNIILLSEDELELVSKADPRALAVALSRDIKKAESSGPAARSSPCACSECREKESGSQQVSCRACQLLQLQCQAVPCRTLGAITVCCPVPAGGTVVRRQDGCALEQIFGSPVAL
ncbi:hypothetical protein ACRRTK_021657 [Alexandromys fortis]